MALARAGQQSQGRSTPRHPGGLPLASAPGERNPFLTGEPRLSLGDTKGMPKTKPN